MKDVDLSLGQFAACDACKVTGKLEKKRTPPVLALLVS